MRHHSFYSHWIKLCSIALLVLIPAHTNLGWSQTIDQSLTIQQYVNDVLLGEGVNATNISFIGSPDQIGYMTGGEDAGFPVDGGLILSSGNAQNLFCGGLAETYAGGTPTDSDLLDIANSVPGLIGQTFAVNSVNDLCVLEFDFDPAGDFVSFNYVFASEEYRDMVLNGSDTTYTGGFVNTQYNDIFSFFLSGDGITGPYDAPPEFPGQAVNIASVPNSNPALPITISSVNDELNSEYYQGVPPDLNGSSLCISGHTVVLTAVYPVVCGETYHIKLAIGDGSDSILDSMVILEEGSFGSPIPTTYESVASPNCDPNPDDDDVIYCAWEDCGPSTITISRPCAVSSLFPFAFQLVESPGSEASLTDDLLGLPTSAVVPVGEYSVSLTFNVPQDDIAEGIETLDLKVISGSIESDLSIIIYDTPPFEPLVEDVVVVPCDESAEVCVDLNQDENFEYPPVSYQWTINGLDFGEDSCVTYQSLTSSLIEVYLEDGCGRSEYLQTLFEVPYTPLDLTMPNDTLLCNGASAIIDLDIAGGQPPYQVQWDDFNDEELSHVVDPEVSTEYEVVVVDNCDYSEFESTQVNVQTVQANILTRSLGNDIYEFDAVVNPAEPFAGAYVYFWDFGDDNFAFEKSPTHQYDGLSKYTATLDVTTDIGCSDVALADIYGNVLFYIPSAFTPDNDGLNDAFEITGRQIRLFEISIYNRWGELVYHSTDLDEVWTGDVNGGTHFAPNGVYQWVIKATGFDTNAQEFRGSVLLMR